MKKKVVKRVIALLAVSVLSVGVLAGCGNTAATDATSDNTAVTEETKEDTETVSDIVADTTEYKVVVIAGPGIDAEGNVSLLGNAAVARDQGYIEEELNAIGYTSDYVGFQSAGVGANEALAAKEADIAIYGDFPAITYVAGGNEAKIIAGNTTRNQLGIFARDGINSVEDLKGKKVATMFGTTAYLYLSNQLNEAGLTIDDIEVVNATVDAISLYLTGEVDAIANSPQLYWGVTANGGQGNEIAINGDKEDLSSYNVVIARTEFLDANPEVEKALVKALKRGYEWANANEDAVYDNLAKSNGYYPAESFKAYYNFEEGFEDMNPEITDAYYTHLQNVADFLYDNQLVLNHVDVNDIIKKVSAE